MLLYLEEMKNGAVTLILNIQSIITLAIKNRTSKKKSKKKKKSCALDG